MNRMNNEAIMKAVELLKEKQEELRVETEKFAQKGNQVAGTRARKAAQEMKKLLQDLRGDIQEVKNSAKK